MMSSRIFRWAAAALIGAAVLGPVSAAPVIWVEIPDAGQTLATANDVQPRSPLDAIVGSLSNEPSSLDMVDLYKISIPQPSIFSLSTGTGLDLNLVASPVLYLFDVNGVGIAVDYGSGPNGQAFLSSLPGGVLPGEYYLAIAFVDYVPNDADDAAIFDPFLFDNTVRSLNPLASWSDFTLLQPGVAGAYQIDITGIPLPQTAWLVALGLLGIALKRRTCSQSA